MELKDKYLDRIADALEEQMGVSPKLIGGNVLKPNIYRIADALDPEPTPLKDGTLKNPLARIAEVIESGGFGGGGIKHKFIVGDLVPTDDIGSDGDLFLKKGTVSYVPIATGNDPSHHIAGQNQSTAYRAFDGDAQTMWTTQDRNYNERWIGYDFGVIDPKVINEVRIMPREWMGTLQVHTFIVQGSNDLKTWIDLYNGEIPNSAAVYAGKWVSFYINNDKSYRAYRIVAIDTNDSVTFTLFGIDFLGAQDSISKIYYKVHGIWTDIIGVSSSEFMS